MAQPTSSLMGSTSVKGTADCLLWSPSEMSYETRNRQWMASTMSNLSWSVARSRHQISATASLRAWNIGSPSTKARAATKKMFAHLSSKKVGEISQQRSFPPEIHDSLMQTLTAFSGQTFLWVHIILSSLSSSVLLSKKDLQDAVMRIPV